MPIVYVYLAFAGGEFIEVLYAGINRRDGEIAAAIAQDDFYPDHLTIVIQEWKDCEKVREY